MEALEKDFEDLMDSESEEEEILAEAEVEDVAEEDLSEEDLAKVEKVLAELKELNPDLDLDDVDIVIDEDGEIEIHAEEKTVQDLKYGTSHRVKKRRGTKRTINKGNQAKGQVSRLKTLRKRKGWSSAKRLAAQDDDFDPAELLGVDAEDLGEDFDSEVLELVGETIHGYLQEFSEESLDDESIDELLDSEEFDEEVLNELKKKKRRKLSKIIADSGGMAKYKSAKKAAKAYYKKNKASIKAYAKKRKNKKAKFTYKDSFDPYIDSDGKEVELSSYDAAEDVTALVGDTELSEEFKTKASTIFEAAVSRQVNVHVEHLKETYQEQIEASVEETSDELVVKIDSYLDYVASNWLDQNQVAVDSGARTEINESFIVEMKKVFDSHYIDVPDAKIDVVGDLSDRLGELESKLDDEVTANVSLKREITEHKKNEAIQELSAGLTDLDLEKLKELSQSIEYDGDDGDFTSKLQVIKEQYFPTTTGKVEKVVEEEGTESFEGSNPVMDLYTSTLSRTVNTQEL